MFFFQFASSHVLHTTETARLISQSSPPLPHLKYCRRGCNLFHQTIQQIASVNQKLLTVVAILLQSVLMEHSVFAILRDARLPT